MAMDSIQLDNVAMRYRLYHEKVFTLKEKVINIIKRKNTYEDFFAVKDLSLTVKRGDTLGIVGENGSGKSTLLKMICGVLQPHQGKVKVVGSISALLELGAGFDSELTGRENIFLNGSLMGFSKKQMQKKYAHIVEFSELDNFIDIPVKNYSSGMYMRLGFAIAIDVDPDILIIDEILAVGDTSFQKKCTDKINEFKQMGKTIIIVSHDHGMIKSFCGRAIWLRHGEKVADGASNDVIDEYLEFMQNKNTTPTQA